MMMDYKLNSIMKLYRKELLFFSEIEQSIRKKKEEEEERNQREKMSERIR